jgi:hypothetical protein
MRNGFRVGHESLLKGSVTMQRLKNVLSPLIPGAPLVFVLVIPWP